MAESIDYQAVCQQLQQENERLREKLVSLHNENWLPVEALLQWWHTLDFHEKYLLISGACMVLITIITLIRLVWR